jgi:FMN-dependent NADH-azoreductase
MSKLMKTTHDATTGEIVVREMTNAEIAQYDADVIEAQARKDKQAAKDAAKQAVLDKLGLSADEVAALLG